jgi:phosphate transport system substrate-binding protein
LGAPAGAATPRVVALVGSSTTAKVMSPLAAQWTNSASNVNHNKIVNVPEVLASGQTFTVPGDSTCGQFSYHNPGNLPPNGSSAGISALAADSNGCVDTARSSRGRKSTDPANLDFYAYAVDAVTWAHFTASHAPGSNSLTQSQLQGIYLCTNSGKPRFTNWSQVGGSSATIIRYLPQTGSGTLSFFETKILGLSTSQQGVLDDSSCTVKPKRIQENTGNQVVSTDRSRAILPYSFADWTAQKNAVVPDVRANSVLGKINGIAPNQSTIGIGCGPCFFGRRYVYNVIKHGAPSEAAAIGFGGVISSGNGYVCSNNATKMQTIGKYGFVNLPFAPAGSGLPNSRCRKNPAEL